MNKLFRKLWENRVEMTCRYYPAHSGKAMMYVKFISAGKTMSRMIHLDEFTNVWGGDHVLENVLESYLDEFLAEIRTEFKDTEAAIDAAWDEFNEHMKDRLKKEVKSDV